MRNIIETVIGIVVGITVSIAIITFFPTSFEGLFGPDLDNMGYDGNGTCWTPCGYRSDP